MVPAPSLLDRLKDIAERTVSTFAVTALGLLIVSGVGNVTGLQVAATAGLAAAGVVVKDAAFQLASVSNGGALWQDILLRTFCTYVQAFLSLIIVNGSIDYAHANAALMAAVPAALTVIKGYIAGYVGNHATAGFLPASVPVAPPTTQADAGLAA